MNNVVIFAMLIMIALFNLDSFLPQKSQASARPLLTPDSYVLKIEHDNHVLERAGREWRQVSAVQPLDITPAAQMAHWQRAMLEPATRESGMQSADTPVVVVVWLAGQSEGQVYAFYPAMPYALVKHDGQWFTLKDATLHQLLPWWSESVEQN